MGIKLNLNQSAIAGKFEQAHKVITDKIVRVLKYCGEMAVNEARMNGNYMDQTGNLRSSIGYVIIVDGKIIDENFTLPGGSEGKNTGLDLAREIAMSKPDIALVVVAGMKYASQVESRGRNVLTSAEQMASRIVPDLLRQLR